LQHDAVVVEPRLGTSRPGTERDRKMKQRDEGREQHLLAHGRILSLEGIGLRDSAPAAELSGRARPRGRRSREGALAVPEVTKS
jgi:hypothetical protein